MEKFFTNKSIWKKIVVVILIIMAFQVFVSVPIVRADEDKSDAAQEGDNIVWKGVLTRPLFSVLVSLGDGIINILHSQIMGQEKSLEVINIGGDDPGWFLAVIGGIVAAILVVAAVALALTGIGAVIEAIGASIAVGAIGAGTVICAAGVGTVVAFAIHDAMMPDTLYLPTYTYSAEEIFKGNILLFNVNFFDIKSKEIFVNYSWEEEEEKTENMGTTSGGAEVTSKTSEVVKKSDSCSLDTYENGVLKGDGGPYSVNYYYYMAKDSEGKDIEVKTSSQDSGRFLRGTISSWYVAIRNICIVGMLSVLIYVAIKMMLTTVASDKAKYKEMLKDWLVGLCLLFVMHYIMAFSVVIVEKVTEVVKTSVDKNLYMGILADKDGKLSEALKGTDLSENIQNGYLYYPVNLMGYIRLEIQKLDIEKTGAYLGFTMCFLILVIFTVLFTFTYLKRLLYMAFLTIIAPLVALTYCIDKINDGQAQGFNMWLKEYIFNLLIQPMHLILYFILVSSAINLSGKNIVYSLVALFFMLPAEKLLRSMFGFEKAKTPPLLGGPVATSLMMQGMNSLSRLARGGRFSHDGADRNRGIRDNESEEGMVGQNMDMTRALAGNNSQPARNNPQPARNSHQDNLEIGDNQYNRDTPGDTGNTNQQYNTNENPENENLSNSPEFDRRMANMDAEQNAIDTMFEGEDESAITDEDRLYQQQLQDELDRKRAELMAENSRIRMHNIYNPEDENRNSLNTNRNNMGRRRLEAGTQGNGRRTPQPQISQRNTSGASSQSAQSKPKRGRIRRAVGTALKSKGKSMLGIDSTFKGTLKNNGKRLGGLAYKGVSGVAKRVPGAAVGLAAGVTTAALGTSVAIATGDEKNVVTAAGTAVGVGYSVGSRVSGTMTTTNLDEGTRHALDAAKETYNTDEYKQEKLDKQITKERENDVNRVKAERELGKEAADRFMGENGNLGVMMESGVSDFDHMLAIEKGINQGEFENVEEGLGTYALLQSFGGKGPEQIRDHRTKDNLDKTIMDIVSPALGRDTDAAINRQTRIKTNMGRLYTRINN